MNAIVVDTCSKLSIMYGKQLNEKDAEIEKLKEENQHIKTMKQHLNSCVKENNELKRKLKTFEKKRFRKSWKKEYGELMDKYDELFQKYNGVNISDSEEENELIDEWKESIRETNRSR